MATVGLVTAKEKSSFQKDSRMNAECREKRGETVLLGFLIIFFILFGSFPVALLSLSSLVHACVFRKIPLFLLNRHKVGFWHF